MLVDKFKKANEAADNKAQKKDEKNKELGYLEKIGMKVMDNL